MSKNREPEWYEHLIAIVFTIIGTAMLFPFVVYFVSSFVEHITE